MYPMGLRVVSIRTRMIISGLNRQQDVKLISAMINCLEEDNFFHANRIYVRFIKRYGVDSRNE